MHRVLSPYEKHHSTALDAGRLAQKLCVRRLVLYHTEDETLMTRAQRYAAEAKEAFGGEVIVPEDLQHVSILRLLFSPFFAML